MRGRLVLGLVMALWYGALAVQAEPLGPDRKAQIRQIVGQALSKSPVPSASVAIVMDGQLAYAEAFGLAQLEPARPATPATRYDIGSVSKQFTAAAVLLLAADGRLSLDDTVGRYLPGVSGGDVVTVRQLLAQTAGYAGYPDWYFLTDEMRAPIAPQAIVDRWGRRPLTSTPGGAWGYSNTNYVMAGRIVEIVSGRSLREVLEQGVFAPLGMDAVGDADGAPPGLADASGYGRDLLGPARPAEAWGRGWAFGAGGLSMTASDLARWDMALLRRSPLPAWLYEEMTREVVLPDGKGTGYGLGVYVDKVGEHRRIHHDGVAAGGMTENRIYPDKGLAIVVMVNAGFGQTNYAIADGVESLLLGTPIPPEFRPDEPPRPASRLIRTLVDEVRTGRLDRRRFTPEAAAFLTPQRLGDYRESLARLPPPATFKEVFHDRDDGMDVTVFEMTWPERRLLGKIKVDGDGKVAEFSMISPD